MPNNTKSDIDFQPKTKEYSYSSKSKTSKNYRVYLLVGIILLIVILLSTLLYLNNVGNIKTITKQEVSQNAKTLGAPYYNPDSKQTVISAVFIGLNKNNLEVQTSEGKMILTLNSNTSLESLVPNSNSNATNGGTLSKGQTYTLDTFANQVPKGSFLQIFYVTEGKNLKAVKIYYLPDHEFN